MKFVSFMVGAMVLAAGETHAAPSQDAAEQIKDADAQLARQDISAARATLERIALALTGAALPGRENRVAMGTLLTALPAPAAESTRCEGYQAGWRKGFADARAGKYGAHRPTPGAEHDKTVEGYEAGWAAGAAPQD